MNDEDREAMVKRLPFYKYDGKTRGKVESVSFSDRFGFTVAWRVCLQDDDDICYSADFAVWEINGYEGDDVGLYGDASNMCGDYTKHDTYMTGNIKWDGCSNWNMGEDGYFHFCSAEQIEDHASLMGYLHNRAFEIMGRDITDETRPVKFEQYAKKESI